MASKSPEFTLAPCATSIEEMVPAFGATISFSIFIASSTNTVCPSETLSPGFTATERMVPASGEVILVLPAFPPAGAAGFGAGAGAAAGAAGAAGATGAAVGAGAV